MRKSVVLTFILLAFLMGGGQALAEDLALADSGRILPTNPFYFMKQFGWGIRKFFTADPLRRIGLELDIADEQSLEIEKLAEITSKEEAISAATENYVENLRKINAKLEPFKNESDKPNIQKLLARFRKHIERIKPVN